jgi:hypothetical protein
VGNHPVRQGVRFNAKRINSRRSKALIIKVLEKTDLFCHIARGMLLNSCCGEDGTVHYLRVNCRHRQCLIEFSCKAQSRL